MPRPRRNDVAEYICTQPCWHNGIRWWRGRRGLFSDATLPHNKKGEVVHFAPVGPDTVVPEPGPVSVNGEERVE